ncbi:unnamed protein product [Mesocestoides corti]|uniref:Uncharacterized protein n=1 Tax=Mesocestoides corti TaxID=53468 RepID=A0A0R3UDE4_MESCO|nr:unnamed protein product [Mesocestoides corti]
MIDICVPVIAAHFGSINTEVTFHSATEVDSLSSLLSDDRLVGVAGAAKLRTIANWFEADSTANKANVAAFVDVDDDSRDATFKDLIGAVDLSEITSDDFFEFCIWISLPDMPTRLENTGAVSVPVVVGGYIYIRGTLDTAELLSCSTADNGVEN